MSDKLSVKFDDESSQSYCRRGVGALAAIRGVSMGEMLILLVDAELEKLGIALDED